MLPDARIPRAAPVRCMAAAESCPIAPSRGAGAPSGCVVADLARSRPRTVPEVTGRRRGSTRASTQQPDLVLVAARELERLARVERDEVFAVEVAAELGHALEVHDRGPMDALEARR